MGLFDFFKRAGRSLAPGKAKAAPATLDSKDDVDTPTAAEIKAEVVSHLPEAQSLTFEVVGDTVKISGSASQETREKVIVAAGNIAGVAKIDEAIQVIHKVQTQAAPAPAPSAAAPAPVQAQGAPAPQTAPKPAATAGTAPAPAAPTAPPAQPAAAPAQPQTQVAAARTVSAEAAPAPAPAAESTYVMVEKGDTLWKIAAKAYGDGAQYKKIFEANRPMLSHPDKIYPGQTLRVPPK